MAREPVTGERLQQFLHHLGRRFRGRGRIYLAGGAGMIVHGFRDQTVDVDYLAEVEGDRGGLPPQV